MLKWARSAHFNIKTSFQRRLNSYHFLVYLRSTISSPKPWRKYSRPDALRGKKGSSNLNGNNLGERMTVSSEARFLFSLIKTALIIHSCPSVNAARDQFADPTYAVSRPESRRKSQALACRRERLASNDTRTSTPGRRASRSRATASVAPM